MKRTQRLAHSGGGDGIISPRTGTEWAKTVSAIALGARKADVIIWAKFVEELNLRHSNEVTVKDGRRLCSLDRLPALSLVWVGAQSGDGNRLVTLSLPNSDAQVPAAVLGASL